MKRPRLQDDPADTIHSEQSSSSDVETGTSCSVARPLPVKSISQIPTKQISEEERLLQRAEMYQLYMKQIPIPTERGSLIPCYTWTELGKSLKQLYQQPLHYLTNILLKTWDQERIGTKDEDQPLDSIIHPAKAEATIWTVEEVHRLTSSHLHIAQLWRQDPLYQAYIDSVVPKVYSESR